MAVLNPYDKLLESQGLSYEDLLPAEKEIYLAAASGSKPISVEDLHQHFAEALYILLIQLCDTPDTPEHQDLNNKLKARVKNYAVMQAFLDTPQKVARALQKQIDGTVVNKY